MFRVGVQSSGLGLHVGVPVTLVLVPWDAGLRVKYKDLLTRFRNPAKRSLGYSDHHTSSGKNFHPSPKALLQLLGALRLQVPSRAEFLFGSQENMTPKIFRYNASEI